MKYEDISRIYTEKVAEYMANGYAININTMAGHQGEIVKIDLRKGTEVVRILLETEHKNFREAVVLTVGRNLDERIAADADTRRDLTIWNNRLEVIERRTFWQMTKNWREIDFYLEGDAGEQAIEKTEQRSRTRYFNEHPTRDFEGMEKRMVKAVKRHLNRSSFKSQNIKRVWKSWDNNEGRYIYQIKTLKHTIVLH